VKRERFRKRERGSRKRQRQK